MNASRPRPTGPFGTDPANQADQARRAASPDTRMPDIPYDSDAAGALDISHVHTHLLEPPEYLWPLLATARLTDPEPTLPPEQHDRRHDHDLQTIAIAEHLQAALRLRKEADQLFAAFQRCSAQANALVQRWFRLMHTERRSPQQAAQYIQLEEQVLAIARKLASLRQRHAACLAQASEHEEAVGR